MVVASVAGAKREERGQPSEDAVAVASREGVALVAVADGAGSQPLGGEGARFAVHAAVESLKAGLARRPPLALGELLAGAIRDARVALVAVAGAANHDHDEADPDRIELGQLATTLTVAAVTPAEVGVGSVGDGIHVLRGHGGGLELVAMAADTDIANHTDFVTGPDLEGKITVELRPAAEVESLLLSTDGLDSHLLGRAEGQRWALPATVNSLLDAPVLEGWGGAELERLLTSDFVREHTSDDCSLVLVRLLAPADSEGRAVDGLLLSRAPDLPTGRRAWRVAGCADLLAVEPSDSVPPEGRVARRESQVWDRTQRYPPVGWPVRRLDGGLVLVPRMSAATRDLRGLLRRGSRGRRAKLVAGIRGCVEALHDAGVAHGELTLECFGRQPDGSISLCDPGPGMFEGADLHICSRLDRQFVAELEKRAKVVGRPAKSRRPRVLGRIRRSDSG